TPTSSRLARIAASELDGWASSRGGEAVSQTFKLSGATTAESRKTSDGFVSGSTPSLLAAVAFLRFTKWPAPGSEDTELGVLMEPEVGHGETEVYSRVQA